MERRRRHHNHEEPEEANQCTDASRAFLQAFLTRGTLTLEEAKPIIAAILNISGRIEAEERGEQPPDEFGPELITQEEFDQFISVASAAVSPFDYEIRSEIHQVTGVRVWALVNTTPDDVTALVRGPSASTAAAASVGSGPVGTAAEREQLAFVRRVFDAIFDTNNTQRREAMCVREDAAIRLCKPPPRRESVQQSQLQRRRTGNANGDEDDEMVDDDENDGSRTRTVQDRGLTQAEAARVLADLVAEGWLELSRARYYSPGPRALMELRQWLVDQYNDRAEDEEDETADGRGPGATWQRIKHCAACRHIVTRGLRCDEVTCNLRLHVHCRDAFWRSQQARTASVGPGTAAGQGRKLCPRCRTPWSGRKYVGEWVDTASKVSRAAMAAAGAGAGGTTHAARRSLGGRTAGAAAGASRRLAGGLPSLAEGEARRLSHRTR